MVQKTDHVTRSHIIWIFVCLRVRFLRLGIKCKRFDPIFVLIKYQFNHEKKKSILGSP